VRSFRVFLMQFCFMLFAGLLSASAQTKWQVLKTFPVGGEGGWDYVTVDAPAHRFFVTRATHTIAVDERTGKVLGDIPGQVRSHGVALAPELGRGFITDGGGSGGIIVFDLKTYAVLGRLQAIPDADGIIYDASQKKVVAVSGDGAALLTVSPDVNPKSGKLDPQIPLGGKPEFLAADGAGKVYVNLVEDNVVAVVDLHSRKVVARWPVAPGGRPVGMAIDPAAHLLFIGCRDPHMMIVMSTETGKVVAALPIGPGVDATRYDAGQVFASTGGDGSLTIIGKQDGKWAVEQTLKTLPGARTMGLDRTTRKIFLPTADLEPATTGRPRPKPGTFKVVVVGGE
jgi:DNA-binding beta-propeller fold protein YncE